MHQLAMTLMSYAGDILTIMVCLGVFLLALSIIVLACAGIMSMFLGGGK